MKLETIQFNKYGWKYKTYVDNSYIIVHNKEYEEQDIKWWIYDNKANIRL